MKIVTEPTLVQPAAPTSRVWSVVRLVLGLAAFTAALAYVASHYRSALEHAGGWFIDTLGMPGIALGAFLADGLHFPVPPQFYLLAGIAAGQSGTLTFFVVLFGSVLGGLLAFTLGRVASRSPFVTRYFERSARILGDLLESRGTWGLVLTGLLPFSYCLLAATAGALRLPYRAYGVLALMRLPRLLISYALVALVWQAT